MEIKRQERWKREKVRDEVSLSPTDQAETGQWTTQQETNSTADLFTSTDRLSTNLHNMTHDYMCWLDRLAAFAVNKFDLLSKLRQAPTSERTECLWIHFSALLTVVLLSVFLGSGRPHALLFCSFTCRASGILNITALVLFPNMSIHELQLSKETYIYPLKINNQQRLFVDWSVFLAVVPTKHRSIGSVCVSLFLVVVGGGVKCVCTCVYTFFVSAVDTRVSLTSVHF